MEILRKVELRSLNKNGFNGLYSYPNTTGTVLVPKAIKGGHLTGLTKEEEAEYEKKLNLSPGTLNNRNNDFWSALETRIKTKTVLDLNDPMDYLRYKYLTAYGKLICPSTLELSKYPEAQFVIHDEETSAKLEAVRIDYEMEAAEEFTNLSEESKKEMLTAFGKKNLNLSSPDLIKTQLYKLMKDDPKLFVQTVRDPNLKVRVFIEKLRDEKVITVERGMYKFGDDVLATGLEDMIVYLNSSKNAMTVVALKNKLDKIKADKSEKV